MLREKSVVPWVILVDKICTLLNAWPQIPVGTGVGICILESEFPKPGD